MRINNAYDKGVYIGGGEALRITDKFEVEKPYYDTGHIDKDRMLELALDYIDVLELEIGEMKEEREGY